MPIEIPKASRYQTPFNDKFNDYPYVLNEYADTKLLFSSEINLHPYENEVTLWITVNSHFVADSEAEWIHLYSNKYGYYRQFRREQMLSFMASEIARLEQEAK